MYHSVPRGLVSPATKKKVGIDPVTQKHDFHNKNLICLLTFELFLVFLNMS